MKKFILLLTTLALLSPTLRAQNCYDLYYDHLLPDPTPSIQFTFDNPTPTIGGLVNFSGEYQLFISSNPSYWRDYASYKVEVVSFPFYPNCSASGCGTNSTVRKMTNFGAYASTSDTYYWDTPHQASPQVAHRVYEGVFNNNVTGGSHMSDYQTLLSNVFTVGGAWNSLVSSAGRVFYPHKVLRHTLYRHHPDNNSKIDSVSFVLDHSRGRMAYYPFKSDNTYSAAVEHDVTLYPIIEVSSNETPISPASTMYLQSSNGGYPVGYHPNNNNLDYLGAPPNSSIKHQYVVDQLIDLSTINPQEKIIYNPEEVSIDLNGTLVFPMGYTFKTVYGLYPSQAQIDAADPMGLQPYNQKVHIDGSYHSTYTVESGSTLLIEGCVNLYDMDIVVEAGGTLLYDQTSVKMQDVNLINNGGTIVSNHQAPVPLFCQNDCYDSNKYDMADYTLSSDENWSAGSLPNPISYGNQLRIAGTLRIGSGHTLQLQGVELLFSFGKKTYLFREFVLHTQAKNRLIWFLLIHRKQGSIGIKNVCS